MYGDIIKEKANKMKQMLMKKITRKQACSESLHLEQLSSKIPDFAFDYRVYRTISSTRLNKTLHMYI